MFGPPGIAYVYLVYGMYDCLNIVTEPEGRPAAVLVRAVEPLEGVDAMRASRFAVTRARRRAVTPDGPEAARLARLRDDRVASGPGLVAAAFGIGRDDTGRDLCDPGSPLRLEGRPADEPAPSVVATARIGIGYAPEPWISVPWRFVIAGHPSASGPARLR
jgi:DNA-3-methyladenine glycosylase